MPEPALQPAAGPSLAAAAAASHITASAAARPVAAPHGLSRCAPIDAGAPDPLPVAVLGLGRIGALHAENLATGLPHAQLAAVADLREDQARSVGERFDVPWTTSPEALYEDHRVRAVVIATPTPTHPTLIQQAAAAGKHIFCEKPVAPDLQQTIAAVEAAAVARVRLQVGFHIRYDPQYALLQSEVMAGGLGNIVLFHARLRDMHPPGHQYLDNSGGLLVDGAIHLFDLATWMVGEIEHVTAVVTASPASPATTSGVDCSAVILQFANGALGIVENSRNCGYGFECSAEVVGSLRAARVGDHHRPQIEWLETGRRSIEIVSDFTHRFPLAYREELVSFVDAVRLGRPANPCGASAVLAASIAQAAETSRREARTIEVALPPAARALVPKRSASGGHDPPLCGR